LSILQFASFCSPSFLNLEVVLAKPNDDEGELLLVVSPSASVRGVEVSERGVVTSVIGVDAFVLGMEASDTGVEASVTGVLASVIGVDALEDPAKLEWPLVVCPTSFVQLSWRPCCSMTSSRMSSKMASLAKLVENLLASATVADDSRNLTGNECDIISVDDTNGKCHD
jgi:hypothetical protein